MSSELDLQEYDLPDDIKPVWWKHIVLFVLACVTTSMAGMFFAGGKAFSLEDWSNPDMMWPALGYSFCVMLILFSHEMGHYLQAKRYKVPVSPPYFIPGLPIPTMGVLPMIGTFGAVIRMELKPLRALPLLRIGAWGPIAGFIVTVPVMILGMYLSDIRPLPPEDSGAFQLGDSLLMMMSTKLFFEAPPAGHDVFVHPVGMAGWTGCLLTSINLLPFGQLDGGHIAYTVFGERFNKAVPWMYALFIIMGLGVSTSWLGLALLVYFIGVKHPPILRGGTVQGADRTLAVVSLVVMILTFSFQPIVMPSLLEMLFDYLLQLS